MFNRTKMLLLFRLLTSKQLQLEGEFYQNFMEGGRTVAEFCNTDVEPMYRESDHIHIIGNFYLLPFTIIMHIFHKYTRMGLQQF